MSRTQSTTAQPRHYIFKGKFVVCVLLIDWLLQTDFVCFCGFAVACDGLSVVFAWHFCKSSYENQNQPSTVVRWAECPRQYCVSAGSRLSTNTTSLEYHELNFNFLEPAMWQCCLPILGIQSVNFQAHLFLVNVG